MANEAGTTRAECRNGHPWPAGQTTCPECGATPRTQWGPIGSIKPQGYPHTVREWVSTGLALLLFSLLFFAMSTGTDNTTAFFVLTVIAWGLVLLGWFFVTVGAVIKGASIALADRDRS